MKLIADYLADAMKLERLASDEKSAAIKRRLKRQAAAFRRLAAKRAKKLGLPPLKSQPVVDGRQV